MDQLKQIQQKNNSLLAQIESLLELKLFLEAEIEDLESNVSMLLLKRQRIEVQLKTENYATLAGGFSPFNP